MANEPMFAARRAYERRLTEDGTLRRRAAGLIVIGVGCLLIAMATGDLFTVTVGLISLGAGGIWRWYLS
jgi:ATP-dependent protease HslVU (ClpYQ) peptidase subunit